MGTTTANVAEPTKNAVVHTKDGDAVAPDSSGGIRLWPWCHLDSSFLILWILSQQKDLNIV